jgi:hypothetical protein
VVLLGGESTVAQIVGRDASTAIALLKIERTDLQYGCCGACRKDRGPSSLRRCPMRHAARSHDCHLMLKDIE